MSLIEVTIAGAIMIAGGYALMSMQENNTKSVNHVEFKLKREQLKTHITAQFLSNSNNCKCLFAGMDEFHANIQNPNQAITLTGAAPAEIGRYFFPTAGNCTGATIPNPILKIGTVMDGIKATDIKITDVMGWDGLYSGNLTIEMETEKRMMGNNRIGIKIPISISTVPGSNPSRARFSNCSAKPDSNRRPTVGFSFDPAEGVGDAINPVSGTFAFTNVPATAKAVMIAYTIGGPSQSRGDRRCTIAGGKTNLLLGTDSKGDGGQRQVGGTAFVPLNPCGTGLTMSCNNGGGQGKITVLAVLDDGDTSCATAGQLCPAGYYMADDGQCYDAGGAIAPVACPTGQVYDNGVCVTAPTGGTPPPTEPPPDTEPPYQCFVAGTMITMADGSKKAIEKISLGEIIKTYDESKSAQLTSPVVKVLHHEKKQHVLFSISLDNGKKVTSNDVHLFFVLDYMRYMSAAEIYEAFIRDERLSLLSERGQKITITGMLRDEKEVVLYNLHVKGRYDSAKGEVNINHNYYANGVLVHNFKGPIP